MIRLRVVPLALFAVLAFSTRAALARPIDARPAAAAAANTSPTLVSADLPTTFLRTVIALPYQSLQTIARAHRMSVKRLVALNPGLRRENLQQGDAVVVIDSLESLPRLPDSRAELARGVRGRKQIALTFDCGWVDKNDLDRLLSVLRHHDMKASFFLTGIFFRVNPGGLNVLARAGYPLYNHSQTHPHFTTLGNTQAQAELLRVEKTVRTSTSLTTRPFWRPPFGDRDARILDAAAAIGFRSVYWTIDSHDSATSPTLNPKQLFKRVCREPFRRTMSDPDPLDGAIVLFHGAARATPDALEMIIPYLRRKGYEFVDLPTLISPCALR